MDRAARLVALAEATVADPNASLEDVVRVERLADQAVRRLHLDRPRRPTVSKPSRPAADVIREGIEELQREEGAS
jgi:hypothetical protein